MVNESLKDAADVSANSIAVSRTLIARLSLHLAACGLSQAKQRQAQQQKSNSSLFHPYTSCFFYTCFQSSPAGTWIRLGLPCLSILTHWPPMVTILPSLSLWGPFRATSLQPLSIAAKSAFQRATVARQVRYIR
jgi:hypothetical protein